MLPRLLLICCLSVVYMTYRNGTVEALFFRQRPQTVLVGGGPNGQSMLMGNGQSLVLNGNGVNGGGQSMMLGNGQSLLMNGNGANGGGGMVFRTARLSPLQQLFSNTADQEVVVLQNPGIQGFAGGFGGFGNSTNNTKYYKNEKHYHNHYHTHKKPKYHHYYHKKSYHHEEPEHYHHEEPHHYHHKYHDDHDKYDDKHSHYSSHHHYNDDDDGGMEDDDPQETRLNAKVLRSHYRSGHSHGSKRSRLRGRNKANKEAATTTTTTTPKTSDDTYLEDEPGNEIVQQGSVGPTRVHDFPPPPVIEDDDPDEDDEEDDTFKQIMDVIPFKNLFS